MRARHQFRPGTANRTVVGRLGTVTAVATLLLIGGASGALADSANGDTSTASSVGSDVFGLPLITMLWLLAGVLAIVVGFTISRRVRRAADIHQLSSPAATAPATVLNIREQS